MELLKSGRVPLAVVRMDWQAEIIKNSMDPDGPARILYGLMVNNYQWLLMVNNG